MNLILRFFEYFLARKALYKVNKFLYFLSLKGLGVDNSSNLTKKADINSIISILKNNKKPVVIDVGANHGTFVELVNNYYPSGIIYAFEPHPATFTSLKNKFPNNHNIKLVNMACSNESGFVNFYDHADNDGSEHATLLKEIFTDLHQSKMIVHNVEAIKLDDFITKNSIGIIDLLKIDTEGYEYNVLEGSADCIKHDQVRAIFFEFNITNVISKYFLRDFIKLLPQYSFYRVLPDGLLRIETDKILLTEIFGFQNIVAINNNLN